MDIADHPRGGADAVIGRPDQGDLQKFTGGEPGQALARAPGQGIDHDALRTGLHHDGHAGLAFNLVHLMLNLLPLMLDRDAHAFDAPVVAHIGDDRQHLTHPAQPHRLMGDPGRDGIKYLGGCEQRQNQQRKYQAPHCFRIWHLFHGMTFSLGWADSDYPKLLFNLFIIKEMQI